MTGLETGEKLQKALKTEGEQVTLAKKSRYLPDSVSISTSQWAGEQFQAGKDGVIFIGACGIAVRSIAPYIAGKKTDPAVLVIDECGQFVISLLSGHLGGANELAVRCAGYLHSTPVVTTATDLHSRFAVDVFAKKNGCAIFHMKAAKEASAALLAGEKIGFYSEFPWEGDLPDGLVLCGKDGIPSTTGTGQRNASAGEVPEIGIAVTLHRSCLPFTNTVHVVPPVAVLGMGCRKGKDAASIQSAAIECLQEADLYKEALHSIASIDLKKDEPGLAAFCKAHGWPITFYSADQLRAVPGRFTPSAFVAGVTGVDNVCERSAMAGSQNGKILISKMAKNGVTAAFVLDEVKISF